MLKPLGFFKKQICLTFKKNSVRHFSTNLLDQKITVLRRFGSLQLPPYLFIPIERNFILNTDKNSYFSK